MRWCPVLRCRRGAARGRDGPTAAEVTGHQDDIFGADSDAEVGAAGGEGDHSGVVPEPPHPPSGIGRPFDRVDRREGVPEEKRCRGPNEDVPDPPAVTASALAAQVRHRAWC